MEKLEGQVLDLGSGAREKDQEIKGLGKKMKTQEAAVHPLKQNANIQEQLY